MPDIAGVPGSMPDIAEEPEGASTRSKTKKKRGE